MSRPEDGWKGGRIFLLNLTDSKAIQRYAAWHGVVRGPTFILFDKEGREVRRWETAAPTIGELP